MNLIWASILIPVVTAAVIAVANARAARSLAALGSLASLGALAAFAWQFPAWATGAVFPEPCGCAWLASINATLGVGFDSVSLLLALLEAFLIPICVIGSWTAISERQREYYGWFMLLHASILLAFAARDVLLFYVGYEFTLVPLLFIIAIWGGPERRQAAHKLFLYTFLGSLFFLGSILFVGWQHHASTGLWSWDMGTLSTFASARLPANTQFWLFAALLAGFAVKVPLFPVHTWLPLAHNQAPTAGSVILAGTLLKLGTYGIFRLALPMAPEGGAALAVLASILCTVAVVYAALICWVQTDAKKLVAYSSVSHLGICMLGLFALNPIGAQGSVLYMINHGLSTGALFLLIGMAYERYHVKDMDQIGGLAKRMPVWAFFMVFFTMSSIGLPGLNGFVGEYLCLFGTYIATGDASTGYPGLLGPGFALVAGTGLILGAMYMLLLVGRYVFGPLREPKDDGHGKHDGSHGHDSHGAGHGHDDGRGDLTGREVGLLVPLALVCLFIGVYPKPMLQAIGPVVGRTLAPYPAAVERTLKSQPQAAEAAKAEPKQAEPKEDDRG